MATLRKLQRSIRSQNRTIDGKRVDYLGRKRIAKNLVIAPGPNARMELVRAVATLLEESRCHVAVVCGFARKEDIGPRTFTTGRVQLSRDGLGWDGKGRLMPGTGRDRRGVAAVEMVVGWDRHGNATQVDRADMERKE